MMRCHLEQDVGCQRGIAIFKGSEITKKPDPEKQASRPPRWGNTENANNTQLKDYSFANFLDDKRVFRKSKVSKGILIVPVQ